MNITSALMKTFARVTCGDRWLIYDQEAETWIVYERKYMAKKTKTIIETPIQDEAVEELLKGEGE